MKRSLPVSRSGLLGVALLTGASGCTHNYYYGATPGCSPIGQTVTTQMGQICEVPSGTVVASNAPPAIISQPDSSNAVVSSPNAQRIVISQPSYNPSLSSRLRWRRPDPENVATTRSEGALEESTVK